MALTDLSVKQVEALFLGHKEDGWNYDVWKEWDEFGWDTPSEVLVVPGLGKVRVVENHGGEGQGDGYWLVFEVTEGDVTRHFKIDGYYFSYKGGQYDGPFTEVNPVRRMVTFYE